MIRLAAALMLGLAAGSQVSARDLVAPNPDARPLNQLRISGNACGPAALLSAFDAGSEAWRDLARSLPGKEERTRMSYLIRAHGLRPSASLAGRHRWDRKTGVNILDLTDIANELRANRWRLPRLRSEVLVREGRESSAKLLRRTHDRLTASLKRGLPPIASLSRVARPAKARGPGVTWRTVYGHYVVIAALPAKLDRRATSFPIRYLDPWGGRVLQGTIAIDDSHGFPSLIARVPSSDVGKKGVKAGETSIVSLSAAIGAF